MDAIKRLRETFAHRHRAGYNVEVSDFLQLADAIERALFTFESTSNHAVLRLYNRGGFSGLNSRGSIYSLNDENPVTVGSENENIFLVYLCVYPPSLSLFYHFRYRWMPRRSLESSTALFSRCRSSPVSSSPSSMRWAGYMLRSV